MPCGDSCSLVKSKIGQAPSAAPTRHPVDCALRPVSLLMGDVGLQVKTIAGFQSARCSTLLGQPHLTLDHQGVGFKRVCVDGSLCPWCPWTFQHFVVTGSEHVVSKLLEGNVGSGHLLDLWTVEDAK